jgi:hypothetical protein
MALEKLQMRSIDEMNVAHLNDREITFHKTAKNISLSINLVAYSCMTILLSIPLMVAGQTFRNLWDAFVVNVILKALRLIFYHGIYQSCRLVGLLLDRISVSR